MYIYIYIYEVLQFSFKNFHILKQIHDSSLLIIIDEPNNFPRPRGTREGALKQALNAGPLDKRPLRTP